LLVGLVFLSSGCSRAQATKLDKTQENMLQVNGAFYAYITEKQRIPTKVEELAPIVAKSGHDPQEVLKSTRDQRQLQLKWKPVHPNNALVGDLMVYEQEGVQGRRYVLAGSEGFVQYRQEDFQQFLETWQKK